MEVGGWLAGRIAGELASYLGGRTNERASYSASAPMHGQIIMDCRPKCSLCRSSAAAKLALKLTWPSFVLFLKAPARFMIDL